MSEHDRDTSTAAADLLPALDSQEFYDLLKTASRRGAGRRFALWGVQKEPLDAALLADGVVYDRECEPVVLTYREGSPVGERSYPFTSVEQALRVASVLGPSRIVWIDEELADD
ncbi:MAG: hypothetical protein ACRDXX_06025 [Stackebrandtia sp.]